MLREHLSAEVAALCYQSSGGGSLAAAFFALVFSLCNDSDDLQFGVHAFRFGHSMVTDSLQVGGSSVSTQDLFSRPHQVISHLDSLLSGMARNPSERADRWYSLTMTDHLFGDLDIAALNIQRGRDHGLPPYNRWRELCGQDTITDFTQLSRHAVRRFTNVYGDPADVDLYSGALTESGQGVVGATYACVLGQQFARLSVCDRFWWETADTNIGFTSALGH
ncbi:hypothetical protein ACOMHN_036250 [Nucella lapillus]